MSRTLKTDISGPDWRVSFDELERCGPSDLFGVETRPRLVLDGGFGRGDTLEVRRAGPRRNVDAGHAGLVREGPAPDFFGDVGHHRCKKTQQHGKPEAQRRHC